MKKAIILLIVVGALGCGSSEIQMKDGKKYRCAAIWGNEDRVYCYDGDGQSFPFETREIKWFTSRRLAP